MKFSWSGLPLAANVSLNNYFHVIQASAENFAFHGMEPAGAERHRREARMGERTGASESNALH
jgi:hypothetical protein